MKSSVYFIDLTSSSNRNITNKINTLLERSNAADIIAPSDIVALKLHFGEKDNFNYIRPQYIKIILDYIKGSDGRPFLTDTNTLYGGQRANAIDHIRLAIAHGFGIASTGSPIIIADGLSGEDYTEFPINAAHTDSAKIGRAITDADSLFVVSHFKGHEQTGFGGALKNIGMGGAARLGKLFIHSTSQPYISKNLCVGCLICGNICPVSAIFFEDKIARIDYEKCTGCGECLISCHFNAIENHWDESLDVLGEKIVEYCLAISRQKKNKVFYINFLMNISPDCDCWSYADAPIVPDIGILASSDPVAIDQASADLVNNAVPIGPLGRARKKSGIKDVIIETHPNLDWRYQLQYAEQIGLGKTDYELIKLK